MHNAITHSGNCLLLLFFAQNQRKQSGAVFSSSTNQSISHHKQQDDYDDDDEKGLLLTRSLLFSSFSSFLYLVQSVVVFVVFFFKMSIDVRKRLLKRLLIGSEPKRTAAAAAGSRQSAIGGRNILSSHLGRQQRRRRRRRRQNIRFSWLLPLSFSSPFASANQKLIQLKKGDQEQALGLHLRGGQRGQEERAHTYTQSRRISILFLGSQLQESGEGGGGEGGLLPFDIFISSLDDDDVRKQERKGKQGDCHPPLLYAKLLSFRLVVL